MYYSGRMKDVSILELNQMHADMAGWFYSGLLLSRQWIFELNIAYSMAI